MQDFTKKHNFITVIITASSLTLFFFLFLKWNPFSENGSYWYFSKIIFEDLKFTILGRAPIYSIYLGSLKNIFGMELAIYIEFIIHCFLGSCLLLYIFLKESENLGLSILALLMVVPLAIFNDPIVQWYGSLFIMVTMALKLKTDWLLILIFLASIFRINSSLLRY